MELRTIERIGRILISRVDVDQLDHFLLVTDPISEGRSAGDRSPAEFGTVLDHREKLGERGKEVEGRAALTNKTLHCFLTPCFFEVLDDRGESPFRPFGSLDPQRYFK